MINKLILLNLFILTGCYSGTQKPLKEYQKQQYRENKIKYPSLYPLSVKEQFGEN